MLKDRKGYYNISNLCCTKWLLSNLPEPHFDLNTGNQTVHLKQGEFILTPKCSSDHPKNQILLYHNTRLLGLVTLQTMTFIIIQNQHVKNK